MRVKAHYDAIFFNTCGVHIKAKNGKYILHKLCVLHKPYGKAKQFVFVFEL
jgi:hypothetical protein